MGVEQSSLHHLQFVQNAAASLLPGKRKRDHITPVFASLHWLPVRFKIDFKILLLDFKVLNGLAELLYHQTTVRAPRSTNQSLFDVRRARLKNKGDRAFAVAAPNLWNSVLIYFKTAKTLETFMVAAEDPPLLAGF